MSKKLLIGKIVNAFGITGEVKVYSYSDDFYRFDDMETVFVEKEEMAIESVRHHKNMILMRLEGVNSRNDAEKFKNRKLYMREEDLEELPEGQYYVRDIVGFDVVDAESGEQLGKLKDVLTDRPQDLYVVTLNQGREIMIPGVEAFIKGVDLDEKQIRVTLIEGMA